MKKIIKFNGEFFDIDQAAVELEDYDAAEKFMAAIEPICKEILNK